jgi:hypothetical protein
MAPSRKADPLQSPSFPSFVLLGKTHIKGLIMEQLEIIDLGDAVTETRCAVTPAATFDNVYGLGHARC